MKRSRVSLAVWIQLAWPLHSHAEPMGGKVVSGQAVIQQATQAGQSVTTITLSTPKATLSWQSFNVGSGEAVRRPWSSVTDNQANLAELASDSRGPGPTNGRQVCHSAVRLAKHRHYSQALHPCTPVPGLNWSGNSNNQQLDLSKT